MRSLTRRSRRRLAHGISYLFLVTVGITMVAPLIWMLATSVKAPDAEVLDPAQWWPEAVHWSNYKTVLVETNGSCDISLVPDGVVTIMDVKCPGSGELGTFDVRNLGRLRRRDQIKFVIYDKRDYEWAKAFVEQHALPGVCEEVIFGPVSGALSPEDLAEWILEDRLIVRLQVPLHKILGLK